MSDLDDLPGRLRSQMHAATAADVAPADLLARVHRAVDHRRHRNAGAAAVLVVTAGAAAAAVSTATPWQAPERLATAPPPAGQSAPAQVLSVVRSGGSAQVSVESSSDRDQRTEQVGLPGYVVNNGDAPLAVLGMSVPGTGLQAAWPGELSLVPGGRLPLTLTRAVDCDAQPTLPAQLDLRIAARGPAGSTTVLLPLPEEVVALYRDAHACSPQRRAADDAEARAAAEQAQRQAGTEAGSWSED